MTYIWAKNRHNLKKKSNKKTNKKTTKTKNKKTKKQKQKTNENMSFSAFFDKIQHLA